MPPHIEPPHPLIAEYIAGYWINERAFTPPNDTFTILPDSMIDLVLSFGAACMGSAGEQEHPLPICYIVGLLERPVHIQATGVLTTIRAHLYPWGVAPLLGALRPHPLPGIYVADEPLAAFAASLQEHARANPQAAVQALQHVLIDRALANTLHDPIVVRAARHILEQHGDLTIEQLAAMNFLSSRALRRRFGALIGVQPKQLARTARFEAVRDALWQNLDADLAQLATTTGYADQAHLQREFREFSRRTPRQFAAEMRRTRDLFRNVRNLQDM